MIKFNLESQQKVCEALETLESSMIVEREELESVSSDISRNNTGLTIQESQMRLQTFIYLGQYNKVFQQVQDMICIHQDSVKKMKKLKNLCNNFYYAFRGAVPKADGLGDGIVMVNDLNMDSLNETQHSIIKNAREVEELLHETIDCCSSLVDFAGYREKVSSACSETDNITVLQASINDFFDEMVKLDTELLEQYSKYKDDEVYNSYVMNYGDDVKYIELKNVLKHKGWTLTEYRSAILDTFMYLDIFDSTDGGCGYDAAKYRERIDQAQTLGELMEILGECELYSNPMAAGNDRRHYYYEIVMDAIDLDPRLADFQIIYRSRTEGENYDNPKYNKGINGIVFKDSSTDSVYVVYRGTSTGEWGDDGRRFSVHDMNDLTPQMKGTLEFFDSVGDRMNWERAKKEGTIQNIIVTGHSQGGNDAQISMLLSKYGSLVDYCYSFDGEGHSPNLIQYLQSTPEKKKEYEKRLQRMYSICGENDFVNHLGEKVISEENTKYVKCAVDAFPRNHDIVSMFCEKKGNTYVYTGNINTSIGTEPKFNVKFTEELWEELKLLPDDKRDNCQDAMMNLAETGLNLLEGKIQVSGLNGEHARLSDYDTFVIEGIPTILNSALITGNDELIECIDNVYAKRIANFVLDGYRKEIVGYVNARIHSSYIVPAQYIHLAEEKVTDIVLDKVFGVENIEEIVNQDRIKDEFSKIIELTGKIIINSNLPLGY